MLIKPQDLSLIKTVHTETFTNDGHLIVASITQVGGLRVEAVDHNYDPIWTGGNIIQARRSLASILASAPKGLFTDIKGLSWLK